MHVAGCGKWFCVGPEMRCFEAQLYTRQVSWQLGDLNPAVLLQIMPKIHQFPAVAPAFPASYVKLVSPAITREPRSVHGDALFQEKSIGSNPGWPPPTRKGTNPGNGNMA